MRADTDDDVVQTLWKVILHVQMRKEKVHFFLYTSDAALDSVLCELLIQLRDEAGFLSVKFQTR